MSLWARIRGMGSDCSKCQGKILALYREPDGSHIFPVEMRDLFAQRIEDAVCGPSTEGRDITIDAGLDPSNLAHFGRIQDFLSELTVLIERKLGEADCDVSQRMRFADALDHLQFKINFECASVVSIFELIRTRIKTEIDVLAQHAANCVSFPLLTSISTIKEEVTTSKRLLEQIQAKVEHYVLCCDKIQKINESLQNQEQLQEIQAEYPDYKSTLRANLSSLSTVCRNSIDAIGQCLHLYHQTVSANIEKLKHVQKQIVCDILRWKTEWQRKAAGLCPKESVTLHTLQVSCEPQADNIWAQYLQLRDAERLLTQNGAFHTDFTPFATLTNQLVSLLGELLNASFIVEGHPQVIKTKTTFLVMVTLLIGLRLGIDMNPPSVSLQISGIQPKLKGNARRSMVKCEERLKVEFKTMQIILPKRTGNGTKANENQLAAEQKHYLRATANVTVGNLQFPISTTSFPIALTTHGKNQGPPAVAAITWSNAFGVSDAGSLRVPIEAKWSDVEKILDTQSVELTGLPLTSQNISHLKQKLFGDTTPDTITWKTLCKDKLSGTQWTFWNWFYLSLHLVAKPVPHQAKSQFYAMYKDQLIFGFVGRDRCPKLLSHCKPGTFLMRFMDSDCGSIAISFLDSSGEIDHYNDLNQQNAAMIIKKHPKLIQLYDRNGRLIPKETAFANIIVPKEEGPYKDIISTITDKMADANLSPGRQEEEEASQSLCNGTHQQPPNPTPVHDIPMEPEDVDSPPWHFDIEDPWQFDDAFDVDELVSGVETYIDTGNYITNGERA